MKNQNKLRKNLKLRKNSYQKIKKIKKNNIQNNLMNNCN